MAVKVLKHAHLEMLLDHELSTDIQKARSEQQQQFEQEAVLLSTLRHPNIVNFLGFTVNDKDVSCGPSLCLLNCMRRVIPNKAVFLALCTLPDEVATYGGLAMKSCRTLAHF